MSATSVLSTTEFESRLELYLFERSEEWRAVRVGEKEVSEQAEIVSPLRRSLQPRAVGRAPGRRGAGLR